jgi:ubiquitin carboxyl-terminal hydrolase 7
VIENLELNPLLERKFNKGAQMEAEKEEQDLFLTVRVVTDKTFSCHEGFDLAIFDESNSPSSDLPTFHVLKQESYGAFKSRVSQHFGYPESQIWLWVIARHGDRMVQADTHIPESEPSLSMSLSLHAGHP